MKSLFRIYRRYIFSAAWIALAVIGVNLAVFGAVSIWLNRMGAEERFSGSRAQLERISAGFSFDGQGNMTLGEEEGRLLEQSGCEFAFLLNDEGDRIWGWRIPEEIGEHFTAGEVAAFSRWYLEDYPVRVWNSGAGLLVLAQKKGSVGKYPVEISVQTLQNTPFMALALIAANLCLVLVFAVLAGYRLYCALRPVAWGLDRLAGQERITLPERGIAADLAARLNQVSRILEQQRQSLEQRDTARTEWISGVSHDIRTPLSMVMGYADQLENDPSLPEKARQEAGIIKAQSVKIKTLIEDLNLTSKLEYRMQPLRVEEYKPAALIRSVVVSCLNSGMREGYELETRIGEEVEGVTLRGDRALLERALQNLIGNSIRHNTACHIVVGAQVEERTIPAQRGEGKRFFCEIFFQRKFFRKQVSPGTRKALFAKSGLRHSQARSVRLCRISVRDDGCGIPLSVRQSLEGKKEGGSAVHIMGLRIVMQIAAAHGGRIEFSQDGREVALYLPMEQGEGVR